MWFVAFPNDLVRFIGGIFAVLLLVLAIITLSWKILVPLGAIFAGSFAYEFISAWLSRRL
jgi:hypothetical protein